MEVKKLRLLPIICLLGSVASAGTNSYLMADVEKLPIDIRIIRNCGNWQHEGQEGYYRLIVGDVHEAAGSELYVQWISNPSQERRSAIVTTTPIIELNDDHNQYYLSSVECKTVGKSTYIMVTGLYEHDQGNQIHKISVKLFGLGKYKLDEKVKRHR